MSPRTSRWLFHPTGTSQTPRVLGLEPIAHEGAGSLKTGRYLPDVKGNQGDLLGTLLTCCGIPLDRPIGIATRQLTEMVAS